MSLTWPWHLYDLDRQSQIFQFCFNCHKFFIYLWILFIHGQNNTYNLADMFWYDLDLDWLGQIFQFCYNFIIVSFNDGCKLYLDKNKQHLWHNLHVWCFCYDLYVTFKRQATTSGFPFLNKKKGECCPLLAVALMLNNFFFIFFTSGCNKIITCACYSKSKK